jgi:uncharacterized protein (DUF433 family)
MLQSHQRWTFNAHTHNPNQVSISYDPIYNVADVARFTRVNRATLHTWVSGRASNGHARSAMPVVFPAVSGEHTELSFINLIEAHVLFSLRQVHHVPLQRIRLAVTWLRQTSKKDHPLAELDLKTDGRDIFVEFFNRLYSASESGQRVMPSVIDPYLSRIARDAKSGLPVLFYPFTRAGTIAPTEVVINPAVVSGRPVISGTRIATTIIMERYRAGESVNDLATEYTVRQDQIEEAIRCELGGLSAA